MKKLLIGLIGIVCLFLIVGFFLPAEYKVERSTNIKAEPQQIFERFNTLEHWKEWMVWIRRDPAMTVEFDGPASGVGATMSWKSESQGSGSLTLDESVAGKHVTYTLSFPDYPPSKGRLEITPGADGHTVSWSDEGNMGASPINRYFGLFLDGLIGPDFEEGLANLKEVCEKLPALEEPEAPETEATDAESAPAEESAAGN